MAPRPRGKWIASLVLASMVVSPTLAPLAFAAVVVLGAYSHGHEHTMSLIGEDGHLHLVLSHPGEGDDHRHPTPQRSHHGEYASGGDHVFDLAEAMASASPRPRTAPDDGFALLPSAVPISEPVLERVVQRRAAAPRLRAQLLRSVVLRL